MKFSKRRQRSRQTGFQAGHPYFRPTVRRSQHQEEVSPGRWLRRLTPEEYSLVVTEAPGGGSALPDEEGQCTGGHLLRPRPHPDSVDATTAYLKGDGKGENRILHNEKTVEMYNDCIAKHNGRQGIDCMTPQFKIHSETKKGLGWYQTLECKKCNFVSKRYKLYDEVQSNSRGPKQARLNLGFQIGLQECPMGNKKAGVLLASANIPPPSPSSLHKVSKKAAKLTTATAEKGLKKIRTNMKEINKLRGTRKPNVIKAVGADSRYNSTSTTGRRKLGQNASQAVGIAVEHQTDKKQIVAVYMENKLCYQGAWLRAKGYRVSCPGGHAGCTATTEYTEPLSEYNIGRKLGEQLALENILVKYIVTDGDSRSASGIQEAMSQIDPLWKSIRQADTTHLGLSLFKHAVRAQYSDEMFPGTSAKDTTEQQMIFARDLKQRCAEVFQKMFSMYKGDMDKIACNMDRTIEATVKCYSGDCGDCKKHSVVCSGGRRNWRATSDNLRIGHITNLYPTQGDRDILRELVRFFLGAGALALIGKNLNTNKNEAANRAIGACNPKNVKRSRTGLARVMSAVSRINKGAGNSLVESLEEAGCPISKGGRVSRATRQIEKRHCYEREYYKRPHVRAATKKRITGHNERHMAAKRRRAASSGAQHQYAKGLLDPPLRLPGTAGMPAGEKAKLDPNEHSYSKHH